MKRRGRQMSADARFFSSFDTKRKEKSLLLFHNLSYNLIEKKHHFRLINDVFFI